MSLSVVPRPKCAKHRIPGKDEKVIVLISRHLTAEGDIVESLLEHVFGRTVDGYIWDEADLVAKLKESDPCCIILFIPLLAADDGSKALIFALIRDMFPGVPILWVARDSSDVPEFLSEEMLVVTLVASYLNGLDVTDFVSLIAGMTNIKPIVNFTPDE